MSERPHGLLWRLLFDALGVTCRCLVVPSRITRYIDYLLNFLVLLHFMLWLSLLVLLLRLHFPEVHLAIAHVVADFVVFGRAGVVSRTTSILLKWQLLVGPLRCMFRLSL